MRSLHDDSVLQRVAEFASRQHPLDGILISGDLAQSGLSEDLGLAADFVYLPPRRSAPEWMAVGPKRVWPTLQASAKPIALAPGNHDRFDGPLSGKPGDENFDRFFERHWKAGVGGVQKYAFPDEEHPHLVVLCADFSLAHKDDATVTYGHWGQGKVYNTPNYPRLQELVDETEKVQERNCSAIVWMTHFAPEFEKVDELPDLKDSLRLIDARELVQKAHKLGIRHILCGHTHILAGDYGSPSKSSVRIYCVGSSAILSPKEEPPSMRLLEFCVEGPCILGVRYQDWIWDRKDRNFRQMSANGTRR